MSLFSSLNYLLTRAASGIHQTTLSKIPTEIIFQETNVSSTLSLIAKGENVTTNSKSYSKYAHFLLIARQIPNDTETNNFIDPTFVSKTLLETQNTYQSESAVQLTNSTYPNAEHLLENWWNIFDSRYLRHGWGWITTLIIAYLLILVAGVIGNLMVILVVFLRPRMRTVTNMFIMNLAVADLFVILFCVPSTLLANTFAPWILGSFMCKAVAYVQGVSVCASAYSLAAISFDRCQAIYRNYEQPRGFSRKICVRTVFIVWTLATSLTIPWAVIFEVKVSEYDGLRYCVEIWTIEEHGNIYFLVVNLVCFYAIPLLLIFVSNWIIYCHVSHRQVPQDSSESSAPVRKMHKQTRQDVLKMLGIVTLTFLFSWLPIYVLMIRIKFADNITESEYNTLGILMPIAQWLGSWNSSINPILYAFLNKKFRRMFKSILPSWIKLQSARQSFGSHTANSYTTAYTRRSLGRSRTNSGIEFYRHHQNGHRNSHRRTDLLISRFYEQTETVATTTVQIISRASSDTQIHTNNQRVTDL